MEWNTCSCLLEGSKLPKKCIICEEVVIALLHEWELKEHCKIHRVDLICGWPDFVCPPCKEEGWYSTNGAGGPPELKNIKTGASKQHPDK